VIRRGDFSRDFSSDFVIRVTIKGHPEVDLLETVKRAVLFLREKADALVLEAHVAPDKVEAIAWKAAGDI
jgi:hypothetical protein